MLSHNSKAQMLWYDTHRVILTFDLHVLDCSCDLERSSNMLFAQLQGFVAQSFSLLSHTVLTMLFGNRFAAVLDCFLKAFTSSNFAPALANGCCCIFITCTSITEPSANAYLLLLEAHILFLCFT